MGDPRQEETSRRMMGLATPMRSWLGTASTAQWVNQITEAGADSSSLVAVWSASGPTVVRVFAPFAASVADAAFLPPAFWSHQPSAWPVAGDPVPASVEVFGPPRLALHIALLAAAGICCLVSGFRC